MLETLRTTFGFAPKGVALDFHSFRCKDRAEFIQLLAEVTSALENTQAETDHFIYITGGLCSGKSLAAEVVAKTLDDAYKLNDILKADPQKKYFLEKGRCQTGTITHNFLKNGTACTTLFKSAAGFDEHLDRYFLSSEFRNATQDMPTTSILTGWADQKTISRNLDDIAHKPILIIDLGPREFKDDEARTIRVAVIAPSLQQNSAFQAKLEILKKQFPMPLLSRRHSYGS